ncbi:MAG: hypothetical protein IJA11_02425 [Oscillospiraceae bacterium]|nr:hypothetical protein [Oscillospiraceae bacterium]
MKKAIFLILAFLMCLSLCACGNKDDDLSRYMPQKTEKESPITPRKENAKGSRSNPYSLNEKIVFSSVDMGLNNMYKTTVTVDKLSSSQFDLAKSIYEKRNNSTCSEIYSISFEIECVKGNNSEKLSDRTDSGGCFLKHGLDMSMQETYFNFFDKTSGNYIYDLYPDVEYDLYMVPMDNITCKYITFEYHIDKYETETIWIEVK